MQDYTFSKAYKRNHNKKFILIVDDDKNIRFILKTLFAKSNYQANCTELCMSCVGALQDLQQ